MKLFAKNKKLEPILCSECDFHDVKTSQSGFHLSKN